MTEGRRAGNGPAPRLLGAAAMLMAMAAAVASGCAQEAQDDVPDASGDDSPDSSAPAEVALVTGSTGGLGREVALGLAADGTHVLIHGRDRERGLEVVQEIEAAGGTADFLRADLASLDEVRELGDTVLEEYARLDILVNNAGVWLEPEDGRVLSDDGHELHFQVNYLSHYLLTRLLLPRLQESAPSRVVSVASSAQQPLDFDDVMLAEDYSSGRAYAQSKLAQILFTVDLAEELEGTGVLPVALHPATMMDTEMVLSRGAEPRASVEEGREAVLNAIRSDDVEPGAYFNGLESTRAHGQVYDEEARDRLRRLSAELTA